MLRNAVRFLVVPLLAMTLTPGPSISIAGLLCATGSSDVNCASTGSGMCWAASGDNSFGVYGSVSDAWGHSEGDWCSAYGCATIHAIATTVDCYGEGYAFDGTICCD